MQKDNNVKVNQQRAFQNEAVLKLNNDFEDHTSIDEAYCTSKFAVPLLDVGPSKSPSLT